MQDQDLHIESLQKNGTDAHQLYDQINILHQKISQIQNSKDYSEQAQSKHELKLHQLQKQNQKLEDKYELAHQIIEQYRALITLLLENTSDSDIVKQVEKLTFKSIKQVEQAKYELKSKNQQLDVYKQTVNELQQSLATSFVDKTQVIEPNNMILDISQSDMENMVQSHFKFYEKIQFQIDEIEHLKYPKPDLHQVFQLIKQESKPVKIRKSNKKQPSQTRELIQNITENYKKIHSRHQKLIQNTTSSTELTLIFQVYYQIDMFIKKQLKITKKPVRDELFSNVLKEFPSASEEIIKLLISSNYQ